MAQQVPISVSPLPTVHEGNRQDGEGQCRLYNNSSMVAQTRMVHYPPQQVEVSVPSPPPAARSINSGPRTDSAPQPGHVTLDSGEGPTSTVTEELTVRLNGILEAALKLTTRASNLFYLSGPIIFVAVGR